MRGWGVALLAGTALSCAGAKVEEGPLTAGLGTSPTSVGEGSQSGGSDSTGGGENGTSASDVTSAGDSTSAGTSGVSSATDDESGPGPDSSGEVGSSEASSAEGSTSGPAPFCGDGQVDAGEDCDDMNMVETDACLSTCAAATCGDSIVHAGVEACDDGVNDGAYGGCNPGCAALAPYCGDGAVQAANEHCDGATGYVNVGCTNCLYDFSTIQQLYCNGTCSWAGAGSCDQADADIYCKLVTGDSMSTAQSFSTVVALDAPGFSCPSYGTNLGALPAFGVAVSVWYQDSSIFANHGPGYVVSAVTCS